jgi:DNA-binding transcriptional ArsR family regulator
MSPKGRSRAAARLEARAPAFAALGNQTRLSLIARLSRGRPCSISELTEGTKLTRQAITKHLRVLERAGMVHPARAGRQSLFELDPGPIQGMKEYLDFISQHWDRALDRLKAYVERSS